MSLRILPPKELKAKAVAKVRAFRLEEKRKALETKRNPPAAKPVEKPPVVAEAVVEKLTPTKRKELNELLLSNALHGNKDEVERLLKAGADVNARNDYGQTALMRAAARGHGEVAQMLIDAGADVNAKSNQRNTALDIANMNNRRKTAEFLKSKGAKRGSDLP